MRSEPEPQLEQTWDEPVKELLWTLSADGIVRSISAYCAHATSWDESDCPGRPFHSFIHPMELARMQSSYPDLLKGEAKQLDGFRVRTRKGNYLTFTLSLAPIIQSEILREILVLGTPKPPDETTTGEPERNIRPFFGIKGKGALEASSMANLLESLLANAPVGFALLDEKLRFICLNQTFAGLTGFSPEQQLGVPIQQFFPHIGHALTSLLEQILVTGSSVLDHEIALQKNISPEASRHALMSFYPIPDGLGGTCGIAIIGADITDRKRANQRLKTISDKLTRSNEALETFCQTVSHDLNEPLRTIASYVKLLENKHRGTTDEDAEDYIQYAVQGTQHMRYLIDGLLDFARAGHSQVEISQVDCNQVLKTVSRDLEAILKETNTTLVHDDLPSIPGNKLILIQVFQNLIANAIKFRSATPCRVQVTFEKTAHDWVFSVIDNGIGIKEKYLSTIFTPFKRLHSQSQYAGAGLGLAICQTNIERMNGKIWVTSEEGRGSVFSFSIPTTPPEETGADAIV